MNHLNHEHLPDREPSPRDALLCDRALGSLDATGERELKAMAADDDTSFELAAAAALRGSILNTPLPAKAQSIMLGCAERFIAGTTGAPGSVSPDRAPAVAPAGIGWRVAAMSGWLAAAAMVALLVYPQWTTRLGQDKPSTVPTSDSFAQFTAEARDLQMLNWTAVDDRVRCQGDICWSTDLQRGYIRIRGLPPNNPRREQYQLWIFCRYRPEKTPVDGGVFDIPEGGGEVLIPVHAKLHVGDVHAFAITREPPGGVVVSDRKNLVLLAKP